MGPLGLNLVSGLVSRRLWLIKVNSCLIMSYYYVLFHELNIVARVSDCEYDLMGSNATSSRCLTSGMEVIGSLSFSKVYPACNYIGTNVT